MGFLEEFVVLVVGVGVGEGGVDGVLGLFFGFVQDCWDYAIVV